MNITNTIVEGFYLIGGNTLGLGFYLNSSNNNTIYGNTIILNYKGIVIDDSSNSNNVYRNNITLNGSDAGVTISYSNFNSIHNNIMDNNSYGVALMEAEYNTIFSNDIIGNTNGGVCQGYASSNNLVYLNNLINNLPNAVVDNDWDGSTWHNVWDNGSVGNYWSDYQINYPNSTEGNSLGIWNTPYFIHGKNSDYYPLMEPIFNTYLTPKITILSVLNQTYNESSVPLEFAVEKDVSWTVYSLDGKQNITISGNSTITNIANGQHNVTIYGNDTFGNSGASQTISFTVAKPEAFPTVAVATISEWL